MSEQDGEAELMVADYLMAASISLAVDGGKATLIGNFTTGDGGVTEVFSGDSTSQDGGAATGVIVVADDGCIWMMPVSVLWKYTIVVVWAVNPDKQKFDEHDFSG
eukprot:scaffold80_cov246-Chaetoceros_neogracile.AAC.8